jgi:hypothetical protein
VQYNRVHKQLWVSAAAASALLLLGACSSRNPDALTGMNVDENLAMMNADENADANASNVGTSEASEASAPRSNDASEATAAVPGGVSAAEENQRTAEANAIVPDEQEASPPADETDNQPVGNEDRLSGGT